MPDNKKPIDLSKIFKRKEAGKAEFGTFAPPPVSFGQQPFLIRLTMKASFGLIKTPKQASYVLIILSLIIFALAIYFFAFHSPAPSPGPEYGQESGYGGKELPDDYR